MIKKISWIIYLLNCFGVSSFLSHCIRVVVCMFFSICWLRLAQSKSEFVAKIVEYFHEFKENNSAKRCTQTFTLMKRNLIETIDFILIAMWRASSIATSICINGKIGLQSVFRANWNRHSHEFCDYHKFNYLNICISARDQLKIGRFRMNCLGFIHMNINIYNFFFIISYDGVCL